MNPPAFAFVIVPVIASSERTTLRVVSPVRVALARVGAVLSNVTISEPVVAVTCVPDTPFTSLKSIVNGTVQLVSSDNIVYDTV